MLLIHENNYHTTVQRLENKNRSRKELRFVVSVTITILFSRISQLQSKPGIQSIKPRIKINKKHIVRLLKA